MPALEKLVFGWKCKKRKEMQKKSSSFRGVPLRDLTRVSCGSYIGRWGWEGYILQINIIKKLCSILEGDKCEFRRMRGRVSGLQF